MNLKCSASSTVLIIDLIVTLLEVLLVFVTNSKHPRAPIILNCNRNISGHQYDEKLVNNMQTKLDAAREECSLVQEKIVQMGCINFELERELKGAKKRLEKAEVRTQQAEEGIEEAGGNCAQQEKHQQFEFLARVKKPKTTLFIFLRTRK